MLLAPLIASTALAGTLATSLGVTAATVGNVAAIGLTIGASVGLSLAAQLLTPDPAAAAGASKERPSVGNAVPRCAIFGTVATAGQKIHDNVYGSDKRKLQVVFAVADHECIEIQGVIADGKQRDLDAGDGTFDYTVEGYNNRFHAHFKTGTYNQTHFNPLATSAEPPSRWSVDHDLRNIAYVAARYDYRQKDFPTKSPPVCRWIVKGGKWYDPRKDSTVDGGSGLHRWDNKSTWEYTANPAICLYNYLRGYTVNGELWFGAGVPADELDVASFMTAANVCDEDITAPDGTTRNRYELHMIAEGGRNADHRRVLEAALLAMNGIASVRGGTFWIAAGSARTPVVTITDADLMPGAEIRMSDKRAAGQGLFNYVAGTFAAPSREYQAKDLRPYTVAADVTADGRRLETSLDFSMVTNKWQARQIMKQVYRASRYQYNGQITVLPHLMNVEPGDVIRWNSARYGDRQYIVTQWEDRDDDLLSATWSLVETAAAVWSDDAEDYDDEAVVDNVEPADTGAPAALTATSVKITGDNGKKKAAAEVTWTPPDDATIDAIVMEIRRQGTTRVVREREDDVEGGTATIVKGFGVDGTYEVRASYIRQDNSQLREWSSWVEVLSDGDDGGDGTSDVTPPATPTGLTLSTRTQTERKSGKTYVEVVAVWNANADADLKDYDFQYRRVGGDGRWRSQTTDEPNFEIAAREEVTYECRVRACDKAGNKSAFTAIASILAAKDTAGPGACSALAVTGGHRRNTLRWVNPIDADFRLVEVWAAKTNDRAQAQRVGKTATDTFTHDSLKNAEAWFYWLRAIDESGNAGAYFPASATGGISSTTSRLVDEDLDPTAPAAPAAPSLSHATRQAGDGGIKSKLVATWSAVADAKHYEIGVREGDEAEEVVKASGLRATYRAASGETYTVRVRAVGFNENRSAWGSAAVYTVGGKTGTPNPPTTLSVGQKPNGLVLRWKESPDSDVKTYDIFRNGSASAPSAAAAPLDTVKGTRFIDDDVVRGSTAYYWVRSVDASGNVSAWTGPVSATARGVKAGDLDATLPLAPGTPVLTQWGDKTADGTRIVRFRATWSAPAGGAPGYKVGVKITGGPEVIYPVGALTYEAIGVLGKTYTVRVFTLDRLGNTSAPSASASITLTADTTAPPVPANVRTRAKKGGVVVTWSPVAAPDLKHYEIYESSVSTAPAATVAPLDRVVATRWVQDEIAQGATRYYFVRAVDRVGNASAWSAASNAGAAAKLQGGDLADGTVDAAQIKAGAVTRITAVNASDVTGRPEIFTVTIPRTAGSRLLIEASWLCDNAGSGGSDGFTSGQATAINAPTLVKRSATTIATIGNRPPLMVGGVSAGQVLGAVVLGGRQEIKVVDLAALAAGNYAYSIVRPWPAGVSERQVIFTEFIR
jgi:predicted phage tail protein